MMGWDLLVVVGCVAFLGIIVLTATRRYGNSGGGDSGSTDLTNGADSDGGGDGGGD